MSSSPSYVIERSQFTVNSTRLVMQKLLIQLAVSKIPINAFMLSYGAGADSTELNAAAFLVTSEALSVQRVLVTLGIQYTMKKAWQVVGLNFTVPGSLSAIYAALHQAGYAPWQWMGEGGSQVYITKPEEGAGVVIEKAVASLRREARNVFST